MGSLPEVRANLERCPEAQLLEECRTDRSWLLASSRLAHLVAVSTEFDLINRASGSRVLDCLRVARLNGSLCAQQRPCAI